MLSHQQGFTLIELLVVVLIIGVLAAVALPQYQRTVEKARFMQVVAVADALTKASKIYYLTNGEYTTNLKNLDVSIELPKGYSVVLYKDVSNFAVDIYRKDPTNTKNTIEYVTYLLYNNKPSNRKECRVWENNSIFHYLCQTISGKTTGKSEGGYYTAYRFE